MELRPSSPHGPLLSQYQALFASCFPDATHLDAQYLSWLYGDNPAGPVIGFDAWDGDVLAAHYVCVPAAAMLHGKPSRVLLSLNTATAPSHQGKGLFTKLANATYDRGAELGFDAVYGVANANSSNRSGPSNGRVASMARCGSRAIRSGSPDSAERGMEMRVASSATRSWRTSRLLLRCLR